MPTVPAANVDRRQRRRLETIEEAIDAAIAIMGEQGAAGLSLGEVARRMGIRPPSLYVYFASKNALYDEIFARGWRALSAAVETPGVPEGRAELRAFLGGRAEAFTRWAIENPASAQLMFWRPVPGYRPSDQAYEPAVRHIDWLGEMFTSLRERSLLTADTPVDEVIRLWSVLIAGVISQQLANAPHEDFDNGAFTTLLPTLIDVFVARFAVAPDASRTESQP
ncbi:TetR/AcrR family transcriptional regulator [Parafrankia elaeagni]|uniref:TetR/AcrR family transcriptional regulator n=1 Tax=Parafrankia elaeagni TaxID=222534 RepID=UPI0003732893|nr:TetR/AcrR family transcriptional regulator [Parafrankia elaeagni]